METLVRKARRADVNTLIDLSRRTISACYRSFLGDAAVDGFLRGGSADRVVQDNLDRCFVIERAGQVVGLAICRDNLIDLLMIDHRHHRQGLGTKLLRRIEASCPPGGAPMRLESFEANEPANAFYRRSGWVEVNRFLDPESGFNKLVYQWAPRPCDP